MYLDNPFYYTPDDSGKRGRHKVLVSMLEALFMLLLGLIGNGLLG